MILIFIHSSWIFLSYFHLPIKFLQMMRHFWAWVLAEWGWAARAVAVLGWQGQPALPCSLQGHSPRSCPLAAALSWRTGELNGRACPVPAALSAWQPFWTCLIYQQRLNLGVSWGTFHWQVQAVVLLHFCPLHHWKRDGIASSLSC